MSVPMANLSLSAADSATFKTWLLANAAGLDNITAAALANAAASPAYNVWRTEVRGSEIDATIIKASYTQAAGDIPGSPSTDLTFQNRGMLVAEMQANAIWITNKLTPIDMTGAQARHNFSDCMTGIPTGASGAPQNAGWGTVAAVGAVRAVCMRLATNAEKLFVLAAAAGPGNDGTSSRGAALNPDALNYEGAITAEQVAEIRGS